jgi:hypothetical protein
MFHFCSKCATSFMFTFVLCNVDRYMFGINWPSSEVLIAMLKERAILVSVIALKELYVVLWCCHAHVHLICNKLR